MLTESPRYSLAPETLTGSPNTHQLPEALTRSPKLASPLKHSLGPPSTSRAPKVPIHSDQPVALPPRRQDRMETSPSGNSQQRVSTGSGLVTGLSLLPASRRPGALSSSALPPEGTLLPRGDSRRMPPFPREVPALQPLPPPSPAARGPGPERADLPGPPPHLGSLPLCLPGGRRVRTAVSDRGLQPGLRVAR